MAADFGIVFLLHIILILVAFASPFLFNWKIVLAIIFLYRLQYITIGRCILTKAQFPDGGGFWYYYATKMGIVISERTLDLFTDYIIPIIIIIIAIAYQVYFKRRAYFSKIQ